MGAAIAPLLAPAPGNAVQSPTVLEHGARAGRPSGSDRRRRVVLVRHENPQDRVQQELAARDDHEDQHVQQPRLPGTHPETLAEAGTHAAEYAPLAGPDQASSPECLLYIAHRSRMRPYGPGWHGDLALT